MTEYSSALKAVLFDLGGTLWEWREGLMPERMLAAVAPRAIRMLPPDQAAAITPDALGVAVRRTYLELEAAACAGDPSPLPAELPVRRGLATLGVTVDDEMARAMLAALYVSERETTRLLPGAEQTLHTLREHGLRLGIISNRMYGGASLLDDLTYFGISHFFDGIVTSCEAGQMKPHPALFGQALQDLGVEPAEAVMVGDDLCADVGGALTAGMRAVWVRRPPDRTDDPPPGVPSIRRLDELPSLLLAPSHGSA